MDPTDLRRPALKVACAADWRLEISPGQAEVTVIEEVAAVH